MRIGQRIHSLRTARGLTQKELADALDTSGANISRWEAGSQPRPETLRKIAEFFEKSIDGLIGNHHVDMDSHVRVVGYVEAGVWAETFEFLPDDVYEAPIPNKPKFEGSFGLEVRGRSMDQEYPPGHTVLVCKRLIDMPRELQPQDHVIAVRHRAGKMEATVKELRIGEDGRPWLWPKSTDPRHQQPIPVEPDDSDEETTTEVHAVVIGAFIERL